MNIFTMLSSYKDSKKITFGIKIKSLAITIVMFAYRVLRVSTPVLFFHLINIAVSELDREVSIMLHCG